jgi:hypothetical protein
MVADTGATPCPGGIRPLDAPQLVQVDVGEDDMPAAIGASSLTPTFRHPSPGGRGVGGEGYFESSETAGLRTGLSKGRWRKILEVLDTWRIEDEWWRKQPVSRLYYRVILEDGTIVGLFKDLVSSDWYSQRG